MASAARTRGLRSLAHRVILADGWTRRLLALLSGAVGALALAPVDLFPALAVPMTVAVWLLDGAAAGRRRLSAASLRSAAAAGWWWGFGYFLAGFWWLGAAFLVDERYAWALPVGVVALPAVLAVFTAGGFVAARLLWSPGAGRVLALAAGLGLSEWLRGTVLTGLPWNAFGMALGGNLVLAQAASVVGLHGLTLLAVALAAAPATLVDGNGGSGRPALAAIVVLAGLAVFGALRLAGGQPGTVEGVRLRLMQPNLVHDEARFGADKKDAILARFLALSDRAKSPTASGLADVTHLVWPETALPTLLSRDAETLQRIGAALPANVVLLAGAYRTGGPGGDGRQTFFNAIQVVGSGGQILDSYDKLHLVPFGEYVPLSSILDRIGLTAFVQIPGAFEAGRSRPFLRVPGLPPVLPLICYEAIFPDAVARRDRAGESAGLMLNVSDDGWFGMTAGPYQHLAQARLRTVEQGLPMVRSAGTGISAVIDPYGRVVGSVPLGVEDILDSPLPRAIADPPFARYGELPAAMLWGLMVVGAFILRRPPAGKASP